MEIQREREMQLMKALGDPDWRVRRKTVASFLGEIGEGSLAEIVHKLRNEHRDAPVLSSIIQVLVSIGSEALPSLLELTKDPDAEVRMYSALALGDLKDPRAIPALSALLRDADVNVRYHAIEALSKLKAIEAVDE